jgi:hypothetical protein
MSARGKAATKDERRRAHAGRVLARAVRIKHAGRLTDAEAIDLLDSFEDLAQSLGRAMRNIIDALAPAFTQLRLEYAGIARISGAIAEAEAARDSGDEIRILHARDELQIALRSGKASSAEAGWDKAIEAELDELMPSERIDRQLGRRRGEHT